MPLASPRMWASPTSALFPSRDGHRLPCAGSAADSNAKQVFISTHHAAFLADLNDPVTDLLGKRLIVVPEPAIWRIRLLPWQGGELSAADHDRRQLPADARDDRRDRSRSRTARRRSGVALARRDGRARGSSRRPAPFLRVFGRSCVELQCLLDRPSEALRAAEGDFGAAASSSKPFG